MASSTSASSSRQLNLKLSELGWTEVSSKIADWSQVASIDLSFNPLQCDCEMTWLKDVLSGIEAANLNDTDSSAQPKSQVICQLPQSLEGKSLLVSALKWYNMRMSIYSYTFDFDTFKNDTFRSVIFRYSQ